VLQSQLIGPSSQFTLVNNQVHATLQFEVRGTTLTLKVQGNALTTVTVNDGSITAAGAVGIRTSAGILVDNFSATT
jgi:hypothetical protein